MAFPPQFLDELLARSDITDIISDYVTLTRKGSNLFGLCPFHNEKTPSFSVAPDKQIYHCFGCGKGGSVINFIMEQENLSFPDAVHFLAKRAGMQVPEYEGQRAAGRLRERILSLNRDAARFFYRQLQEQEGEEVRAYLARRQIHPQTAIRFGMGASPNTWDALMTAMVSQGYTKAELLTAGLAAKNKSGGLYDKFRHRLMLPVIDVRGDVIGFGSRVIDGSEPKYMNTTDTITYSKRRVLYAMNLAKKTKRTNIILCEGNLDVVTLHQAGFDNAVASMGTALTVEQIRLLSRYTREVVLCYDNDTAGKTATQRALELLNQSELTARVLQLPNIMVDGKPAKQDADDFIKHHGRDAFERLLNSSDNSIDYRMSVIASQYDFRDDHQKVAYSAEISQFLASLSNPVEREIYTARAANLCGVTTQSMQNETERAMRTRQKRIQTQKQRSELNPSLHVQSSNRSMRYANIRSARAEEGVIRLLNADNTLFIPTPPIDASEFSSPLLAKVYQAQLDNVNHGRGGGIILLGDMLTNEEMSHMISIVGQPETHTEREKALADYIGVIKKAAADRNGCDDPLTAAIKNNQDKKQYGGNPHE